MEQNGMSECGIKMKFKQREKMWKCCGQTEVFREKVGRSIRGT